MCFQKDKLKAEEPRIPLLIKNEWRQLSIKYQLQQSMATKDARRAESMSLRSSRRQKCSDTTAPKSPCSAEQLDFPLPPNPTLLIEDHKQQQTAPKNEKQSTALLNNDPPTLLPSEDTIRRVTRSSLVTSKKICSQPDPLDAFTPEDNPISKLSDQPTSKKLGKAVQNVWVSAPAEPATVRKAASKLPQTLVSPYSQVRKSYRRSQRLGLKSIPYRKCHDAFEGRIVAIINKMGSGKNCLRDLQGLLDRLIKITAKDMTNRYVVGGIVTIVRLAGDTGYECKIVQKLQLELKRLKVKIAAELQTPGHYQLPHPSQQRVDCQKYKSMMIRKMYRLMKYKTGGGRELQEKVLWDCQLLAGQTNLEAVIKAFRQQACFLLQ